MRLKEQQWYQLPSGQWVQAVWVDDPLGPILQAYGTDLASSPGYTNAFDIYVERDGFTLGVTGLWRGDTWTLADLRRRPPMKPKPRPTVASSSVAQRAQQLLTRTPCQTPATRPPHRPR